MLWVLASVFKRTGRQNIIRILLFINGVVSILGAIIITVDVSWVLKSFGLINYVASEVKHAGILAGSQKIYEN